MAERIKFRPPPEPAHVSLVRQYEDLVAILKYIRDKGQEVIDQGFDRVSSKIGFVVATTVPVTAEVGKDGKINNLLMRGKHLEGTLFDEILLPALSEKIKGKQIPVAKGSAPSEGNYDFYLLWFDALKLKLGAGQFRPPPEPAHFRLAAELARFRPPPEPAHVSFRPPPEPAHFHLTEELAQFLRGQSTSFLGRFRPPPEPAHWFLPGALITQEEQVLIVALDEVYPELRLVERISASRLGEEVMLNPQPLPPRALAEALVKILSPVPDPWREGPSPEPWRELSAALAKVMAANPQPQPWRARMLEEVAEVISRYGPLSDLGKTSREE
jgi:hypothetical protein